MARDLKVMRAAIGLDVGVGIFMVLGAAATIATAGAAAPALMGESP